MWIHLLSLGLIDGAGGEAVTPKAAGGGYGGGKKKKYIVRRGANLFVYSSAAAAANALNEDEEEEKQEAIAEVAEPVEIEQEDPAQVQISLPAVRAYAKTTGQIQQYSAAYKSEHWDKLIAMFEDMRDEEEVEMLLLAQ